MAVTNGKITTPMSVSDPYTCMGVTPTANGYDVGYVCSNAHGKVNKWSKNKPYDINKMAPLTDAEKKGTAAQNNAGIFFGLKVGSGGTDLTKLHEATYDYVGYPKGGNSVYRILDFDGYDHNAVPTINGTIPTETYYNLDKYFVCTIVYDYNHTNTTGVDIAEIINSDSDATKFESYYPCILVGNYARGLFNQNSNTQTTIKYNNAWYTKFYCDFTGYPGIGAGTKTCTLFFIRELYVQGIIDLRSWVNVGSILSARQGYTIPNAVAVPVDIKEYHPYAILKITAASRIPAGTGIQLSWGFDGDAPSSDTTYTISITPPYKTSQQFTYHATGINDIYIVFTWAQLGLQAAPSSINISGTVSVSGTNVSSFNFNNI